MKGPKLPEKKQRKTNFKLPESSLQELQQQLISKHAFKQFLDQPNKLLAVLQHDPVLAEAAKGNPEIAALLDPSTLQQALNALQPQSQQQHEQQQLPALNIPRKALMQMQNYAMQLNQARAARHNPLPLQQQQQLSLQVQHTAGGQQDALAPAGAAPATRVPDNAMWAAMQQRLSKLQQRSSMLGAMPAAMVPGTQPQDQAHTTMPSPWISAQVQQQHVEQLQHLEQQQHSQQQQQQQACQLPTHKDAVSCLLTQRGSSGSSGSPSGSPQSYRLARLAVPDGLGSSGRIMSPLGMSGTPSALEAASSSQCLSPGTVEALQRRSSSSLSHRLLCHTAASPLGLPDLERSGSQALHVEQLESGGVIVDITPPTRVTQDLAWSTDPTATFVLDAASTGSLDQLHASGSSSTLPVSTLTAGLEPASAGDIAADIAAAVSNTSVADAGQSGQMLQVASGQLQQQQPHLYALPLIGVAATAESEIQVDGASEVSGTGGGSNVTAGRLADGSAAAGAAASGRRSVGSNRQRLVLHVAGAASSSRPQQNPHTSSALQQQQQQQPGASTPLQDDHYSFVDLSDAAASTSDATYATQQQKQQQQYQQHSLYEAAAMSSSLYSSSAAANTALAGARAAAAAGGSLDARTYYESVAPSTWRPSDAEAAVPGDYLELYRRAYCSYADALFPPLWMGLVATLATLQLLPLWQVLVVGLLSFWGGMWLMAIKWAGVPPAHLGLSRVTPTLTVSLELMCLGAFVWQVLPVMWLGHSLVCAVLLCSSVGMVALHATAYLQDPGYTPLPDAEEGMYARHMGPAAANKQQGKQHSAKTSNRAAAGATGDAAQAEQVPLLSTQQQQQQRGQQQVQTGPAAAGTGWGGQLMDQCWTCRVKRNLRSKHCPLCKRCVERFDHHCPVLGNCVGAGNHKTFVAFLAVMLLSQVLFCHVVSTMLTQQYLLQQLSVTQPLQHTDQIGASGGTVSGISASSDLQGLVDGSDSSSTTAGAGASNPATATAAGTPAATAAGGGLKRRLRQRAGRQVHSSSTQGATGPGSVPQGRAVGSGSGSQWRISGTLRALWAARNTHMGLLLLLLAQVPTIFMSGTLLMRALFLAAANLTVNEWMNRHSYVHLHYTGAGFSNRFDRGVAANCYDFWCGPKLQDYWNIWETGEQEMRGKGMTVLAVWSPTVLIRYWDVRWSQYQQRLASSRQRRRELQMQRRMQALGLPSQAHACPART